MQELHDVYVTGYSLLSSLPEDEQAAWQILNHAKESMHTVVNRDERAPFFLHPLTSYPVEEQIPNRSDRRFMGKSMQAAVYTAGKALIMAGLKDQVEFLQDTDVIICFSGGERDEEVDLSMLHSCSTEQDYAALYNEKLMREVRPTLFLSQLPNLLAANIAMVLGPTGYSLTLMGEEFASAEAITLAYQRIQSGKARRVLVGGVALCDTTEMLLRYARENILLAHEFLPVWERLQGGLCLGCASGFLVLESQASMQARGAKAVAKFSHAVCGQDMQQNWQTALAQHPVQQLAVLSTLSGHASQLEQEKLLWQQLQQVYPQSWIRAAATVMGFLSGAAFPSHIILALYCLHQQQLFAPLSQNSAIEKPYTGKTLDKIWVHGQGELSGHALMCLEAV